jgi:hypothetical protein
VNKSRFGGTLQKMPTTFRNSQGRMDLFAGAVPARVQPGWQMLFLARLHGKKKAGPCGSGFLLEVF